MPYKIAVASTDGNIVDGHFGSTSSFFIYEVNEDGKFQKVEVRIVPTNDSNFTREECSNRENCASVVGEGSRGNCTSVVDKVSGGCGGHSDANIDFRVSLISDCRSIICSKVGPKAERLLGKNAITAFQIDVPIDAALQKITLYYYKIDNHISLRKNE